MGYLADLSALAFRFAVALVPDEAGYQLLRTALRPLGREMLSAGGCYDLGFSGNRFEVVALPSSIITSRSAHSPDPDCSRSFRSAK
jgi:hypothetical protein